MAATALSLMGLASFLVCAQGCGKSAAPVAAKAAPTTTGKAKKEWLGDTPEPKDWGRESEPPKPPTPPTATSVPAPSAPAPESSTPPPSRPKASAQANDDEAAPSRKAKKPARPTDVADWKRDDYYIARKDGDQQLIAAVSYLGGHFVGETRTAELLVRLLEPPTDEGPNGRSREGRGSDVNLIEAIVAALVVNGTPLAWQTIDQLASGNLRTSDNRAAAVAALKMLIGRPGQENEEAVVRTVALAGQPQPFDRSPADLKTQHDMLLNLLKSSASAPLRVRLANYMIAAETPQNWYNQLWTCLQEPRPENLGAQCVLYRSERPDATARRLLEQRLIAAGGAAVGRLLGTIPPAEQQPAGSAIASADPYLMAEQMWSPAFASAIEHRLAAIDTLEQGANQLLLCSLVPVERVRAAILRTLRMHWEEDPKPLESARLAGKTVPEPGFLLLAKLLLRKEAAAPGIAGGSVAHAPPGKGAKTLKNAKVAALREARQQREQMSQQWAKFAENLLRAMGQQFRAAAKTQADAGSDAKDLRLKLHSPADIVAAYRADWPDGLSGKPAALGVSPLHVRYARMEQQARPLKVVAYYRRQLPDCEEHRVDQGVWLDALSAVGDGGTARSIDVVITKASKDLPAVADQEQRIIIEVLTIECGGIAAKAAVAIGK